MNTNNPIQDASLRAVMRERDTLRAALQAVVDGHDDAIGEARRLLQQGPCGDTSGYGLVQIAWELERTSLGEGHYGNALRVAKDIPGVLDEERSLLDRWATRRNGRGDAADLQRLAVKLYAMAEKSSS